eukprot:TRINITY_DN19380_c0_g1_i1.p1 TRINITY_DN19380_c0_g1~~TRINITY_DN19380_c0_g1_i1.p1  ORF type:complete len:844 (+),score=130.39 TRINITY_DN19380_c0_g1_i1:277-2532(+)
MDAEKCETLPSVTKRVDACACDVAFGAVSEASLSTLPTERHGTVRCIESSEAIDGQCEVVCAHSTVENSEMSTTAVSPTVRSASARQSAVGAKGCLPTDDNMLTLPNLLRRSTHVPNDAMDTVISRASCSLRAALGVESECFELFSERTRSALRMDDERLLRATKVSIVLTGVGRILQNNAGTAETYALSGIVSKIDVFISHNWSTPRFKKFLALAWFFNFRVAVVVVVVVSSAYVVLIVLGVLRDYSEIEVYTGRGYEGQGFFCQLLGVVAFLSALFFWHEVAPRRGGQSAFLDKTCIHQTDPELKARGIKSLAAFLCFARTLLVIYSDTYLQRVWTVYELASFLAMRPGGNIVVLPLWTAKTILIATPCFSALRILVSLSTTRAIRERFVDGGFREEAPFAAMICVTSLPFAVLLAAMGRSWGRERAQSEARVACFSIRDAFCYDEVDRAIVHGNVASFMTDFGFVRPGAKQNVALEAFDALVREDVAAALAASFGPVGVQYRFVAILFLGEGLSALDRLGCSFVNGGSGRERWLDLSQALLLHFTVYPLVSAFAFRIMRKALFLRGFADVAFFVGVGCIALLFVMVAVVGLTAIKSFAEVSELGIGVFAGVACILIKITRICYKRPARTTERWRPFLKSDAMREAAFSETHAIEKRPSYCSVDSKDSNPNRIPSWEFPTSRSQSASDEDLSVSCSSSTDGSPARPETKHDCAQAAAPPPPPTNHTALSFCGVRKLVATASTSAESCSL